MKTDKVLLEKLLTMSKIRLDEKTKVSMHAELNGMRAWVKQLQEVDTTDVAPLYHINQGHATLRPDEPQKALKRDIALRNAPAHDGEYVSVPGFDNKHLSKL